MARASKPFSQHAREQLAINLGQPWFQELIENMRYAATFAERSYTQSRTISEVEHQALNGSFREGAAWQVDRILLLAQDPREIPEQKMPFGELVPIAPDPKLTYTKKK